MNALTGELERLGQGLANAKGRAALSRLHLVVVALVFVLAVGSRILGPWPPFDRLEGRVVPVLLVVVLLGLLHPVLALFVGRVLRPPSRWMARRLDDEQAWADAADTALSASSGGGGTVEVFLEAQTLGRLRGLQPSRIWPVTRRGRWTRRLVLVLLVLVAAVLLLPGVSGLGGRHGAGRGHAAAPGTSPEEDEALDADQWLREHARLILTKSQAPRLLDAKLLTDAPLPADYKTALWLDWDGEPFHVGPLDLPAGEKVRHAIELPLDAIEGLADKLTVGKHLAQVRLVPREGPWTIDVPSNELEVLIEEEDDGGGGGQQEEEPEPQAQPEPEPEPEPPPAEAGAAPEAPEPEPPTEVVDPFVREDPETVEKEDAVVAVPDPDAGLEDPPQVPLDEAVADLERVLERAMGDERVRPSDRAFLLRYFRALQASARGKKEGP